MSKGFHSAAVKAETDSSSALRTAQFDALSRLIPLMYFILLVNSCVLAFTFRHKAPAQLTALPAAVFCGIFVWRLSAWWRRRGHSVTPELARLRLRTTYIMAGGLAAALSAWGFALFPLGDALDKGHVAFFLAFTMISCMFCLIHATPAPQLIAAFSGIPFVVYFALSGDPVFLATSIDVVLVTVAALIIIHIQGRDFAHMITARQEAHLRHEEQSQLLRMFGDLPIAVLTLEVASLRVSYANRAAMTLVRRIEHLLPIQADDLIGSSLDVFQRHAGLQRHLFQDPSLLPHTLRIAVGGEILELKVSAITGPHGEFMGPMIALALITAQAEAEERILHLAHHDQLTGLINRYTFRERLESCLATGEGRCAVIIIDLDGFKTVNDTLGHRAGDSVLCEVARRIETYLSNRALALARLGGDEFAVLLSSSESSGADALAQGLVQVLRAPYPLSDGRHTLIGASAGIAFAPEHGNDCETLLSRADVALYDAKAVGHSAVRSFSVEMLTRIQRRVSLQSGLRAALESRQGLFVFFQPILNLETGEVTTREALVRWHDGPAGWVSPAEFVPVAEELGLIDALGEFVMERACREAAGWTDMARVAVNVSAAQFGKGTLMPSVSRALDSSGLPANRLEVEVTETALLRNGAEAIAELRQLRELGVRVSLDDFGTGYSSLAHLRTFPFDKIKIDGTFVRDAVLRPECAAVVRAVADLGRRLNVVTVAEGVETQAHLDCARAEGCQEAQGYLLGRPAPSIEDLAAIERLTKGVAPLQATHRSLEPA